MNNRQAPLRWRLVTSVGPEQVALVLTVVLALIVALAISFGGWLGNDRLQSPGPSPSPAIDFSRSAPVWFVAKGNARPRLREGLGLLPSGRSSRFGSIPREPWAFREPPPT